MTFVGAYARMKVRKGSHVSTTGCAPASLDSLSCYRNRFLARNLWKIFSPLLTTSLGFLLPIGSSHFLLFFHNWILLLEIGDWLYSSQIFLEINYKIGMISLYSLLHKSNKNKIGEDRIVRRGPNWGQGFLTPSRTPNGPKIFNARRPITPIPAIPKRRFRALDRNFRGSLLW